MYIHKLFIIGGIVLISISSGIAVFSASLQIVAPSSASINGEPFTVSIFLNTEGQPVSAIGGVLSFDSSLVSVERITTQGSAVPLWIQQPKVLDESIQQATTSIVFEGMMPGGFTGVRSPYYKDVRPGSLFTVLLKPKQEGIARISLHDIELHAFDKDGTLLLVSPVTSIVEIPKQSTVYPSTEKQPLYVTSDTLEVAVRREQLIENNSWYLVVHEDQTARPVQSMYIVEADTFDPQNVQVADWNRLETIYILKHQDRSKYIHVKVVYDNDIYTIKTIPPVENSTQHFYSSRILVYIALLFLVIFLYRYGSLHTQHFLYRNKK